MQRRFAELWARLVQRQANRLLLAHREGEACDIESPHCQYCARPACVDICPSGAMVRDEASGTVKLIEEKCIGCWMCVLGCPVGALTPVEGMQRPLRREPEGLDRVALIDAREMEADLRERRRQFARSGWAWQGIEAFPAPTDKPHQRSDDVAVKTSAITYVIVGAGVAALRAVQSIRQRDSDGQIVVISAEDEQPYSRVLLPKVVSGQLQADQLGLREPGWWQEQGVELVLGDPAVRLDPDQQAVHLSSGRQCRYDRLLVASGAHGSRPSSLPGVSLGNVYTLHDMESARRLKVAPACNAVVVGGGFAAVKAAEALKLRGLGVTLVVRSRLFRRSLDPMAAQIVGDHLRAKGIKLEIGTDLMELRGESVVERVVLTDERVIECDLVVLGTGVTAATEWLVGSGITLENGVRVNEELRTNLPNVWAAGDVASTLDLFSGRYTANAIWPAASDQGKTAGANMTGARQTYDGSLTMNTLDLMGLPLATFGNAGDGDETVYNRSNGDYQSLVFVGGKLSGAVLIGDISMCGRFLSAARLQALGIEKPF